MNNAINEIKKKNTLEGTNSRITEAEDRISEVEDRMVEINETEKKELKEMRTTSETSGTMLKLLPVAEIKHEGRKCNCLNDLLSHLSRALSSAIS